MMENRFDIQAVGLVPATKTLTYHRYCEAISAGLPPQLEYLARNAACRIDFEALMAGTVTVVCCAVFLPVFDIRTPIHYARFCAIGDYHLVVRERIAALEAWLRSRYPIQNSRICVDSAPVLERELAVRAGIGSIGRNHQVFHPEYGSYIVLGELLVDVDLMPFREEIEFGVIPHTEEFGDFTPGNTGCCEGRCVEACPTQALTKHGYDASRCLAYWTTQHKGQIPEPFASAMQDVIWGCDRCQIICPRNANVPAALISDDSNPLNTLTMREILTLSARKLRQRLSNSCIADAHPYMLVRNACLVIRNTHTASLYRHELEQLSTSHACEWVRDTARLALESSETIQVSQH